MCWESVGLKISIRRTHCMQSSIWRKGGLTYQLFVSQKQMGGDFLKTKGENGKWQNKQVHFSLSSFFHLLSAEEERSVRVSLLRWLLSVLALSHRFLLHRCIWTSVLLTPVCSDELPPPSCMPLTYGMQAATTGKARRCHTCQRAAAWLKWNGEI